MIRVVAAVSVMSILSPLGGAAALELLTPARADSAIGSPDKTWQGETAARGEAAESPASTRAAVVSADSPDSEAGTTLLRRGSGPPRGSHRTSHRPVTCGDARRGIVYYRAKTWGYQARQDVRRTLTAHAERSPGCQFVHWAARRWRARARSARESFESWYRRAYAKWRCVHEHEGAWNDDGLPHEGGLQFDRDFQATYGPEFVRRWGTADHWPPWAQLLAAERAYHGYAGYGPRGFHPWPNTARACGLL